MVIHLLGTVIATVTAVRVFATDIRSITRRALGAGVRVGAASLREEHHRTVWRVPDDLPTGSRSGEEA